jgi:hypothetical protein
MQKCIALGALNVKVTTRQHGLNRVGNVVGSDRLAG